MILPTKELAELLAGYRRFRESGWKPERERWATLREGQEPRIMVIACSDSRVDPAQIFDVNPGEIFVVRNVAALVPPFETNPGATGSRRRSSSRCRCSRCAKSCVMGHGMCGGCKAALTQELRGASPARAASSPTGSRCSTTAREPIARSLGTTGREAERAMELAAVEVSLANLRTFPCIREKESRGPDPARRVLRHLATGWLHLLDEKTGSSSRPRRPSALPRRVLPVRRGH